MIRRGWGAPDQEPLKWEDILNMDHTHEQGRPEFVVAPEKKGTYNTFISEITSSGMFIDALCRRSTTLCTAPLDAICSDTLDLEEIQRVAASYKDNAVATTCLEALALIKEPAVFLGTFCSAPRVCKARAKLAKEDWEAMSALIEPAGNDAVGCTIGAFKVPKKNGKSRLILDGRPLNEAQKEPPPLHLPRIATLVESLKKYEKIMTIDAKSFFYQFGLHPYIRKFFGIRRNVARGSPENWLFKRLPMGWKYAPFIAQSVATFILQRLRDTVQFDFHSAVWIDNFIFGVSNDNAAELRRAFEKVSQQFHLQLHEWSDGIFLGLVRHEDGEVRIANPIIARWREALTDLQRTTVRGLAHVVGFGAFVGFITATADGGRMAQLASAIARTAARHGWDMPITVSEETVQWLWTKFNELQRAPVREIRHDGNAAVVVSDASRAGGAFSCPDAITDEMKDRIRFGPFNSDSQRIFFCELLVALGALATTAAAGHRAAHPQVDNTAVMWALRAQRSANPVANHWITIVMGSLPSSFTYNVTYIHTELNPMDRYTRERTLEHMRLSMKG